MRRRIETSGRGGVKGKCVRNTEKSSTEKRHGRNSERGQSLVELALVTPLLCIILFALIEFGYVLYDQIELNHAASDGARIAAQAETSTIQARAQTEATGYLSDLRNCPSPSATATYDENVPDIAEVQVTCTYHSVTPLGILVGLVHGTLSTTPTLTGTAYQRVQ